MSLAETGLIFVYWMRVHERASDNPWQTTLMRHAKLLTGLESQCVDY